MSNSNDLERAASVLAAADALFIGAGAGMGVDSGLPDFRGNQGFWKAYPPYRKLGLDFVSLANPRWFRDDPTLAWGFYGHRLTLYRATEPHEGFQILRRWAGRMKHGAFVFTSNVDGQFQKAGFDPERVMEVHGSLDWMQCVGGCGTDVFPSQEVTIDVEEATFRAREPLPTCPRCGGLARPNVLMFGDWDWQDSRTAEQSRRMQDRLEAGVAAKLAVVECGAGLAIPTVRHTCEEIAKQCGGTLTRINVRESEVPSGHIGLRMGALDALRQLDELWT